ncbi:hypothetical protein [Aggregatibacter actinomycetemcomitans]|uniref:hypothetical protein n=1 Tax=Aggregatibacter actinomycetemcomitans TaxID=714 RepID=UPI0015D50DED|nr:hypothetical protein [Aggregatibacter actinomycetemcomitans]
MAKYLVKVLCVAEYPIEAEKMQDAIDACDLNNNDLTRMAHVITEVLDVIEAEPIP